MTEQEMLKEIRSIRDGMDTLGDRMLRLRYADLKNAFMEQIRRAMGEEGRRSFQDESSILHHSSGCENKARCLAHLSEEVDCAADKLMEDDLPGAQSILDGLEELLSGKCSPCLDPSCSQEARENLHRVRAIISIYESLAERLSDRPTPRIISNRTAPSIPPEQAEAILGPLANAWRIKILKILRLGDKSLTDLGRTVDLRTGHLQFHLRALINAGYVEADRPRHLYRITDRGGVALQGIEGLVSRLAT